MAMPAKVFATVPNIRVCFISFNLSGSVERYQWCQTSGIRSFQELYIIASHSLQSTKPSVTAMAFLKIKEIVVPDAKMRFSNSPTNTRLQ